MALYQKTIVYQPLDKMSLLKLLSDNNIFLNHHAEILLENLSYDLGGNDAEINVTELTLEDLNCSSPANYVEISDVLTDLGFSHCPLELAPHIRLAYRDQTNSSLVSKNRHPEDAILIFSKPLINRDDFPKGFYIRRMNEKLWLRGYKCSEDYCWLPSTRLIVCN